MRWRLFVASAPKASPPALGRTKSQNTMSKIKPFQHVIGFSIGIGIFVISIPYGIYLLHQYFDCNLLSISVVNSYLYKGISFFFMGTIFSNLVKYLFGI